MNPLILGLVTGVIFGFLLQKGRVLRFEKQLGALRLQDFTIIKFMLSSILVGMFGLLILQQAGWIALSHKSFNVGAVVIGGALFGVGWAVAGYCPGTSVGAVGEGRWHALFAIAGMLAGAALFAEAYPWLKKTVLAWKDFGKIGLPDLLGINPWWCALGLAILYLGLFVWFERRRL